MPDSDNALATIGFLLIPGFALLPYACAVEPLRAANVLSGRALYAWQHFSPDGGPAAASNGVVIGAAALPDAPNISTLFVCAGGNPAGFRHQPTFARLRRLSRQGVRIGGISGGPYLLARAGLLRGCRFHLCTGNTRRPSPRRFPELDLRRSLFEIDRDRPTCSGGTAALDMMHALIAPGMVRALAGAVSDWFISRRSAPARRRNASGARPAGGAQRLRCCARWRRWRRSWNSPARRRRWPRWPASPASAAAAVPQPNSAARRAPTICCCGWSARGSLSADRSVVAEIAAACGFEQRQPFSRAATGTASACTVPMGGISSFPNSRPGAEQVLQAGARHCPNVMAGEGPWALT